MPPITAKRVGPVGFISICFFAACTTSDGTSTTETTETSPPSGSVSYGDTAAIVARIDSINELIRRDPTRLQLYARIPRQPDLIPVQDSLSWPADVEVSYNIVFDDDGQVLLHTTMPFSESGDWFEATTHYFAPGGRAIFYSYYTTHFQSECVDLLRETTRVFLDPITEQPLARTQSITDGRGTPLQDSTGCYLRGMNAPSPARTAAQLDLPRQR